ncbi:MAG: hypothetical protein KC731_37040, partial [Myxococcales bacterium]|nr:hypothetical protein [Myxococcales bacterium]
PAEEVAEGEDGSGDEDDDYSGVSTGTLGGAGKAARAKGRPMAMEPPPPPASAPAPAKPWAAADRLEGQLYEAEKKEAPAVSVDSLRRSTLAQARASKASGLTRFDIDNRVTVPDGSATMVAIINQAVEGEEAFLYDPRGGGGSGYESNPYRVVRFRNTSPFVLETGPISIYSGGSFVGEGISQEVGAGTSATIPFAVEPGIMVTKESPSTPQELKLLKIVRGTIHVERFHQVKSIWKVKAQEKKEGFKLLIRQPKYSTTYQLKDRPEGTEDLPDAYLLPVVVAAGSQEGGIEVIEQSPSQTTVGLFEHGVIGMLERAMVAEGFSPHGPAELKPIIDLQREIGKLDSQMDSLRRQEDTLNRRISQHRRNLERLKDMKGAEADQMRRERARQLEAFTKEGDEIARNLLVLEETREQKVIVLEDQLENLTLLPEPNKPKK